MHVRWWGRASLPDHFDSWYHNLWITISRLNKQRTNKETMSKLPVPTPAWPRKTKRVIRLHVLVHCYMVMKGYHVYLFENIFLCNFRISFPRWLLQTQLFKYCHWWKAYLTIFFVNNLPDLSKRPISILHSPYNAYPFVFLFFFHPYWSCCFGFCSFFGRGWWVVRRGGIFALEFCFFVGVTK